jgi:hypothetical protein
MPLDPSLGAAVRLQIEATGDDVADRLRAQFEALKATVALTQQTFASGESMYRDYAKQLREVGTEMARLRGIADAAGVGIEGLNRSMEQAAIKAAEDFAKAATRHEQLTEKWATDAEAAALRESEAFAAAAVRHEQVMAKSAADTEAATARDEAAFRREEEAFIRAEGVRRRASESFVRDAAMVNAALESEAREAEAMALREAEAMGAAATRHEHFLAGTGEFADKAKKGMGNLSFAMLNVGYAFQDLTSAGENWERGIAATLNNVPLLVMGVTQAMGASASAAMAWAGGLQIAASAGMLLYQNWSGIMKEFGLQTDDATFSIEKLKDRIKELEGKKTRISFEMTELDEAKKKLKELEDARKAFEAAGEGKTVYEKAAGEQFRKVFEEEGAAGKAARDKIATQFRSELAGIDPGLKKGFQAVSDAEAALARSRSALLAAEGVDPEAAGAIEVRIRSQLADLAKANEQVRVAQKALAQRAESEAGLLFTGTFAGNRPAARAELVRRLGLAGEAPLAAEAQMATPEEMQLKARNAEMLEGRAQEQAREKAARQRQETAQEAANRLAEVNRPESMSPVADMAAQVADEKAKAAAKLRGVGEAADERAIAAGVRQFGGALGKAKGPGSLAAAAEARAEAGQALAETIRDLQGQVVGAIKRMGGDQNVEAIANRVAEEAAMAAQAKVGAGGRRGQFEAGFLAAGAPPELAEAGAGRMDAAMRGGMTAEAALARAQQYIHQTMMANLRQQAINEQMAGMFGEASMQFQMIQGQMRSLQVKRPAVNGAFR